MDGPQLASGSPKPDWRAAAHRGCRRGWVEISRRVRFQTANQQYERAVTFWKNVGRRMLAWLPAREQPSVPEQRPVRVTLSQCHAAALCAGQHKLIPRRVDHPSNVVGAARVGWFVVGRTAAILIP
jgi:hypothetical protein